MSLLSHVNSDTISPIDRSLLRQQVANVLRGLIVNGRIPPGAKITERDVAELLKISRMPARDALMDLERQGLIITRPGGRYVIALSAGEVRQLYQVRLALEKLAVETAIQNIDQTISTGLQQKLADMQRAVQEKNPVLYTTSDLALHELIWRASGNSFLIEMLGSIIGPIFMFISTQTRVDDSWTETFTLHADLVKAIEERALGKALANLDEHMQKSLRLALLAFEENNHASN